MYDFPKDPRKLRERIRRYERKFREEQREFGGIRDGAGKRYLLGPLYLLMDDMEGALLAYAWYEDQFPDDSGEPANHLCWTLALYKSGDLPAATAKLRETMLLNLYLIPDLLGEPQEPIDMWHGCNRSEIEYLEYIPPEFLSLWDHQALAWAKERYESGDFRRIRGRYIEIEKELATLPRGPKRSKLVEEAFALRRS